MGDWRFDLNIGYNFVTSTSGPDVLKNQVVYSFAVERKLSDDWSIFAEVFANTSPALGERGTFSGALAAEYRFTEHFSAFVSVGYDSDHLIHIRPGFTLEF